MNSTYDGYFAIVPFSEIKHIGELKYLREGIVDGDQEAVIVRLRD